MPQPPAVQTAPTLRTCPDCGGILEPSSPPWQTLVQSLQPHAAVPAGDQPTRWQCLICGYRSR
jgi:hypothetical protein